MPNIKDDVIYYCSGITKEQIKTLMVQGINDLEMISRETGACSGCGSCDVTIKDILAESWQSNGHRT
ncbi:MAG: (2Fe-2S)-binding protein [Methylococcaceae bacterium]